MRGRTSADRVDPIPCLMGFAVLPAAKGIELALGAIRTGAIRTLEMNGARLLPLTQPLLKLLGKDTETEVDLEDRLDATRVVKISDVVQIIRNNVNGLQEAADLAADIAPVPLQTFTPGGGKQVKIGLANKMILQIREKALSQASDRKSVTYTYSKREI